MPEPADKDKAEDNPGFWQQIWNAAPRLLSVITLLTLLYASLSWITGGVRPQTQIDLDALKSQQSNIASRVSVCESRLDALPRNNDFSSWEAHLSRLDAVFEALRDQVTQNKYDIKDLVTKYGSLTTTPPRR